MTLTNILNRVKEIDKTLNALPGTVKQQVHQNHMSLDDIIRDKELRNVVKGLFSDGHYARAVEEAFKFVNNTVKYRTQLDPSIDGSKLMKQVFSVNNPILRINSGTTQSEKDEQLGYMEIFSGTMTGVRNPRAHEHDWVDSEHRAIQLLILADHLIEQVRFATKCQTE